MARPSDSDYYDDFDEPGDRYGGRTGTLTATTTTRGPTPGRSRRRGRAAGPVGTPLDNYPLDEGATAVIEADPESRRKRPAPDKQEAKQDTVAIDPCRGGAHAALAGSAHRGRLRRSERSAANEQMVELDHLCAATVQGRTSGHRLHLWDRLSPAEVEPAPGEGG